MAVNASCIHCEKGRCGLTYNIADCDTNNCPMTPRHEFSASEVHVAGVAPDIPVVVNEKGGKQSDTPYAFHMIPTSSIFAAAQTLGYGAKKYGETINDRNYTKIPTEDHINHAIQHLYAFLAGDKQDDHLAHAIARCMFAYDTAQRSEDA